MHLKPDVIQKACEAFLEVHGDPSAGPMDYAHEICAAVTVALHEMSILSQSPIAYRFRDYSDGWVFTEDKRGAEIVRDTDGVRMEPVYSQAHVMALEDRVARLQRALAYWLPNVTPEIEVETAGRCGDDALLLSGYEGQREPSYWEAKK